MCIRDRAIDVLGRREKILYFEGAARFEAKFLRRAVEDDNCLLYTSEAADERASVDLGGRRIIKKKNNQQQRVQQSMTMKNDASKQSSSQTIKWS